MDLYYTPVKAWYTFGEVLTCFSDAVPLPTYQWSNLVTGSVYNSQSVTLLPSDEGLLYLRCQAINAVGSADLLINITVSGTYVVHGQTEFRAISDALMLQVY